MTLFLHGVGHFHPENEISNRFLEELDIGTNDQWILDRVGIRSRRTVLPLDYIRETKNQEPRAAMEAAFYSNAELGRRASEIAIARAGIEKTDIGNGCTQYTPAAVALINAELRDNPDHATVSDAIAAIEGGAALTDVRLSNAVRSYIQELDDYNGIVSYSHFTLRTLYAQFGNDDVDVELERQFAAQR